MAITEGRNGKVTVTAGSSVTKAIHTIGELGTWRISGVSRDLIEHGSFGDTVKQFAVGMLDAGSITFEGFYDPSDTYQAALIANLSSGISVGNSTTAAIRRLRVYNSDDTSVAKKDYFGYWSCSGSAGEMYISSMDLGQDKNGLGTISLTARVSGGSLAFSTVVAP